MTNFYKLYDLTSGLFMLQALFGNRNVERILLFLFVNESGYGKQIENQLRIPLTPIQKALLRLEKGGIVQSSYQGKTRVYQLNPAYSLRQELESLLKKAYTLLSPSEKKQYCLIHKPRMSAKDEGKRERDRSEQLLIFWERLSQVKQLSCTTKSKQGEVLFKSGKADVTAISSHPHTLIFQERGFWFFDSVPHTAFSNSFRWTLDLKASLITLEHLRYGMNHPVFLFHFTSNEAGGLESVDPHLCGDDTYLGHIFFEPKGIFFNWRILGPQKNEELIYHYF